MEKLNTGLKDEHRAGIVDGLNTLLADEHLLYIKTRNYHWNIIGPRFQELHKFLEDQYEQLAETIDEVAENVRQFGGFSLGTMAEFTKVSRLKEHPGRLPDDNGMLQDLLHDHESIIRTLREDIDKATDEYKALDAADFLTSTLERHNKMAWMLRAFLGTGERKAATTGEHRKVEADRGSAKELVGSRH